MTLGKKIKAYRESLNLTQSDLAKRLGTTKQTIFKYENEIITNIPSDKIETLANLFGISPAVLMGWENAEPIRSKPTKQIPVFGTIYPDAAKLTENTQFNSSVRAKISVIIENAENLDARVLHSKTKPFQIYSKEPIKSKDGKTYNYSILVSGRYKVGERLVPYMVTLGFQSEEDFNEVTPVCLQYVNLENGFVYNNIAPEDDILEKLSAKK